MTCFSGLFLDQDPALCTRGVACMSRLCDLQLTGLERELTGLTTCV